MSAPPSLRAHAVVYAAGAEYVFDAPAARIAVTTDAVTQIAPLASPTTAAACGAWYSAMHLNETYNDKVVRQFAIMTVVWGIVGMAVGVLIAAQLYWPALSFDVPWLTYSRLRPLHTNAVIFA